LKNAWFYEKLLKIDISLKSTFGCTSPILEKIGGKVETSRLP